MFWYLCQAAGLDAQAPVVRGAAEHRPAGSELGGGALHGEELPARVQRRRAGGRSRHRAGNVARRERSAGSHGRGGAHEAARDRRDRTTHGPRRGGRARAGHRGQRDRPHARHGCGRSPRSAEAHQGATARSAAGRPGDDPRRAGDVRTTDHHRIDPHALGHAARTSRSSAFGESSGPLRRSTQIEAQMRSIPGVVDLSTDSRRKCLRCASSTTARRSRATAARSRRRAALGSSAVAPK